VETSGMNGSVTGNIVQRLWNLCNILRDDGITYQAYVTELTYLLFLKMLAETGREEIIPAECRWASLTGREGDALLTHYRATLLKLGTAPNPGVRTIFADAQTSLRKPANLRELVGQIDKLDWYSAKEEGLGDLYEGLLEKNAAEKKSGAGQYFTPRPLIDCMVRLLKPRAGEVVQDPAAGTGGFLVAADRYIKKQTDDLFSLPKPMQEFQRREAFRGLELVPDTHRLLVMNLLLHDITPDAVKGGDTMGPDGEALGLADVILTNPPFGTKKGGGRPVRSDFTITADTSNKQLAFMEHIVRALKPGGRAGIVLPDNVLFADGVGRDLRRWMMEVADLHTILRLPTGIFYAQGVKTNVLFLRRGAAPKGNTRGVWVYDMRAGQPAYGKTRPLRAEDFSAFEAAYGDDPNGEAARVDEGPEGRFRRFTREEVAARGDNLDIAWLRGDDAAAEEALEDPADILDAIRTHLARAMVEVEALAGELNGSGERAEVAG
jgi:type I restriction enzyme M protein